MFKSQAEALKSHVGSQGCVIVVGYSDSAGTQSESQN